MKVQKPKSMEQIIRERRKAFGRPKKMPKKKKIDPVGGGYCGEDMSPGGGY